LFRRELIRRRLINFITNFIPNYDAGWVHKLICAKLERFVIDVENKQSPRIMFFQPPRTGKSTIVSKAFPPWVLGKHPNWEFISASYAVSLPMGFSRWIKSTLSSNEYQALYPKTRLDPNAQATDGWYTTEQGMYLPVGVGGGATGKGAHIFNIDDPVKDATEADSETTLQSIWDWWDSVADTRLSPGGGVMLTMTRWSDLDLAGRLIQQEMDAMKEVVEQEDECEITLADPNSTEIMREYSRDRLKAMQQDREDIINWDVVSFPAVAEEDEFIDGRGHLTTTPDEDDPSVRLVRKKDAALHPARYDEAFYRRKKKSTQPRFWNALFMQKPVPDEGSIFKRQNFRLEAHVAPWQRWHVYAAWDLAIGLKQANDWTVGLIAALDFEGRLHLVDRIRARTDDPAKLVFESMKPYQDKLQMCGIERGQIQMAIMPNLMRLLSDNAHGGYPCPFDETLLPINDKVARARPAQGWTQQGKIILPADQPWTEEFIAELLRFPNGVHDDQVDALAWLVRMVNKASTPHRPRVKKVVSWKDKLKSHTRKRGKRAGGSMAA